MANMSLQKHPMPEQDPQVRAGNFKEVALGYTPEIAVEEADLVLSGHVHGGLFRLPLLGGVISPRFQLFPHYDRGVFTDGEHTMILSAGLGWHGFPFRFNNLPEIVNITLEKEE